MAASTLCGIKTAVCKLQNSENGLLLSRGRVWDPRFQCSPLHWGLYPVLTSLSPDPNHPLLQRSHVRLQNRKFCPKVMSKCNDFSGPNPTLTGQKQQERAGFWSKNSKLLLFSPFCLLHVLLLFIFLVSLFLSAFRFHAILDPMHARNSGSCLHKYISPWRLTTSKWVILSASYRWGTRDSEQMAKRKPQTKHASVTAASKPGTAPTHRLSLPFSTLSPSTLFPSLSFLYLSFLFLRSTSKMRKVKINIHWK